jgi:hypothetical protein
VTPLKSVPLKAVSLIVAPVRLAPERSALVTALGKSTPIDRLSGGHWTLVRDDDQAVLTVRVSVEVHSADAP